MKVLHITGDSCFGGAGRIILRLGQAAAMRGWQVDVLTTDPKFQRAAKQYNLNIVGLDVIRRPIRPVWDLTGLARLTAFLREQRYEIVHTHTSKAGFVGRLAAKLARVPIVIHTAHGFAFHEKSSGPARLFYTTLERAAARWCDRVVSVSEFHRRWAIELAICDESRITAIPNGIPELPVPSLERLELRHRLGVAGDELLILNLSRLAPDKGLEYLLEAAARLLRISRRFRIFIAGDGPLLGRLTQLCRTLHLDDRVTFLGFREDVSDLLAASDLVVLPSLREGLSISLLEAMAAGKPIIAASIGSHREVAGESNAARLVPPADPQALYEAIIQLGADPIMMAHLATKAHDLYLLQYTEDRMIESYDRTYATLLHDKLPSQVDLVRSTPGNALLTITKNGGAS